MAQLCGQAWVTLPVRPFSDGVTRRKLVIFSELQLTHPYTAAIGRTTISCFYKNSMRSFMQSTWHSINMKYLINVSCHNA